MRRNKSGLYNKCFADDIIFPISSPSSYHHHHIIVSNIITTTIVMIVITTTMIISCFIIVITTSISIIVMSCSSSGCRNSCCGESSTTLWLNRGCWIRSKQWNRGSSFVTNEWPECFASLHFRSSISFVWPFTQERWICWQSTGT